MSILVIFGIKIQLGRTRAMELLGKTEYVFFTTKYQRLNNLLLEKNLYALKIHYQQSIRYDDYNPMYQLQLLSHTFFLLRIEI